MAIVVAGNEPGVLNLKVRRGDKIGPIDLGWGSSVDLSDRTWAAQIRADLDETGTPTATFTVDVTAAATGTITISLPHSESVNLATVKGKATYYWDLQATKTADPEDVFTWLAGKVTVTGDVTVTA